MIIPVLVIRAFFAQLFNSNQTFSTFKSFYGFYDSVQVPFELSVKNACYYLKLHFFASFVLLIDTLALQVVLIFYVSACKVRKTNYLSYFHQNRQSLSLRFLN